MSTTFNSSSGNITITAYGFSSPADSANAQIYGINDNGDRTGLGLDLTGDDTHEITGSGFIQLDISNLVGRVSDFAFTMESTTGHDVWEVLGSNTLGEPGTALDCAAPHTCPGGSGHDGLMHVISPFPVGLYNYVTFEATSGSVLLGQVSADTGASTQQIAPEPSTWMLIGLGLAGLAIGRRSRKSL